MPRSLFREISRELLNDIKNHPEWNSLPSLHVLAGRLGVSHVTVSKAIHALEDDGVVRCFQGKRVTILRNHIEKKSSPRNEEPQGTTWSAIRAAILGGTWKIGESLPKIAFFATEYHISRDRVCSALRRLEQEGIIYKRGRRWIVGHPPVPHSRYTLRPFSPVVMMVAYKEPLWEMGGTAIPFVRGLGRELQRAGIRLQKGFFTGNRLLHQLYPVGKKAISRTIQELGDRFWGFTFLLMYYRDMHLQEYTPYIRWLESFGKPVVTYDFSSIDELNPGEGPHGKRLYYCSFDIPRATALAARLLHGNGHRRAAAFLSPVENPQLARKRFVALRDAGRKLTPPLLIEEWQMEESVPFLRDYTPGCLSRFVEGIENCCNTAATAPDDSVQTPSGGLLRQRLISLLPSFASLLEQRAITALIGAYDLDCEQYWACLTMLGAKVPRTISLCALDNKYNTDINGITTISYGMEDLGYQAAQLFLKEIPVRPDAQGRLRGIPRVIDRGSMRRLPDKKQPEIL